MIPQGHGSHGWLDTNPKLDANRIATVGGASVGLLRDVIRLMRYWNQERNGERLSGYHVEVLTLLIVESRGLIDVAGTVAYVFNDLITRLAWVCPSQTGFGGNVDAELTDLNRQQSIDAARTAAFAAYAAACLSSVVRHSKKSLLDCASVGRTLLWQRTFRAPTTRFACSANLPYGELFAKFACLRSKVPTVRTWPSAQSSRLRSGKQRI